ncbi:MAG: glycine cleavage system aminomethyltransferase GcvT [Dinoroseobacter sp.]|nr:glycine cleavage system aminomethyltransferase GcvT [Dinoroseobacter sp.]
MGLRRTPLYDLHTSLGAKMVPFAGWEMPVQYGTGVMAEHLATRETAGLFDVSHMGQVIIRALSKKNSDAALALESLIPANYLGLAEGRQRYGVLTNDKGGIRDDLMVANRGDHFFLVVNAGNADADIAYLREHLSDRCEIEVIADRALLALQGPAAEAAFAPIAQGASEMKFMDCAVFESKFGALWVTRSGYSGEDGYEISVATDNAEALTRRLLDTPGVVACGLGARDSLRMEAGLPLHGQDITPDTTPVEAGLGWSIQKVRRTGGDREGGFPGADRILAQFENGPEQKLVGLRPEGRAPMRAGTSLFVDADAADPIGEITSGGFGPSLQAPMSMGYVPAEMAKPGTALMADLRGRRLPVSVTPLPFRPANYKR